MITIEQFYKGRDREYASELTTEIQINAVETLYRVNQLIGRFLPECPDASPLRGCNSGWRPAGINKATPNAAKKSKHLLGLAIDVSDKDRKLSVWILSKAGRLALEEIGLWAERPSATPTWCHLQTVPPRSGNRIYNP